MGLIFSIFYYLFWAAIIFLAFFLAVIAFLFSFFLYVMLTDKPVELPKKY